jgi:acetylornithine deacetylase/succinyl-diaminopimelate desuccinylase-like protein
MTAALAAVAAAAATYVDDLAEFVRVPSVSTAQEHRPDIDAAADWVAARLRKAGVEDVRVLPTAGHPVVVGRLHHDPASRTVIVYGHYDVQPPEPLDLWTSPPFEPDQRDGRLYGRGASDDKAGVLIAIQAVEAYLESGSKPPVNVTFIIEGEEEIGSPNLQQFIRDHRDLLAADLAISADGGIYAPGIPSVTVGSRGLAGVELTVKGASADLHSGMYGGAVANPLMALSRILASMQDVDGTVLVDGFYDGIPPLAQGVRDELARSPDDEASELRNLGLDRWWGVAEFAPRERRTVRPTLEVNGMGGGFQGRGIKTVLPREAKAKITCRLVVGQDPQDIVEKLRAHVTRVTPPGVTVSVEPLAGSGWAYQMPVDHAALAVASDSLEAVYGRPAFPVWTGGTVPVAEQFQRLLGVWCLYFAFGEPDNNIHAPNEFFRIPTLQLGTEATVRLLAGLAAAPAAFEPPA